MSELGHGRRRFGVLHLFLLVPWVGLVVAARSPLRDNSFLWHIRAGELQLDAGAVLTTDPFSFTRYGEAWRTQSWLADLLYRQLEVWSGLGFVPTMIAVVGGLALAVVMLTCWRRTGSVLATAAVGVLTGWVGIGFLSPRPVVFSYLFISLAALMLSERRLDWAVPLLLWVWAATHASFVIGLGMIVLYGLRRQRPWIGRLSVSLLTVSLTAHGLGVWQTLLDFSRNRAALDLITEWGPPRLTGLDLAPYALFLAILVVGAARGSISIRDLWVALPFALFGLTASRAVFPAALVLAPFVASAIASVTERVDRQARPAALPVLVVAGAVIVAVPFLVRPSWAGLDPERFPIELAGQLSDGPLFHDDVVGGYLIYRDGPDRLVAVDDRAELYGVRIFTDVVRARRAHPSWQETLQAWGIEQALLEDDDGLVTVLELSGWSTVASADGFVLLRKPG